MLKIVSVTDVTVGSIFGTYIPKFYTKILIILQIIVKFINFSKPFLKKIKPGKNRSHFSYQLSKWSIRQIADFHPYIYIFVIEQILGGEVGIGVC
jgi:hypothetical protein